MNIKYVNIDEVEPYERNPRNNDSAVEATANSIKEFGWQQPIVVDKNNVIIVGHTRLKAAKKLGLKEVPILVADLPENKVKAYRLADNKTGELAKWDNDKLRQELDDLFDKIDMSDFGFPIQIENIDQDITDPDEKFATELGEANNYVVLEFHSEEEWQNAQAVFGLEKVMTNSKNPKVRRHGLGRVVQGKPVLDKLMQKGDVIHED